MSQNRTLNELVTDVHQTAVEKGWWDGGDRNPLELHMLMVTEVAEATECARSDLPTIYAEVPGPNDLPIHTTDIDRIISEVLKPEGEAIELADVVIRIMDYFGKKDWDLNEAIEMKIAFNKTRPHRHGGKKY